MQDPAHEIKQAFAARRRRQYIVAVPFVLILVASAFVRGGDSTEPFGIPAIWWAPALIVFVAGVLVFSFRNWRCPACDKYLGKGMGPKFCPSCGVALQ